MKAFIQRLTLFAAIPLLVLLTFDIYLRNINSLSSAKYEGLMKVKNEIDVMVLGNSHALYGVNPSNFNDFEVYNLANLNQQIYFDQRLLKKAITDGVSNLKYVLISVDYHSLYTSTQEQNRNVWTYYANGIKYKDQDYTKANLSPFLWGYTPKVAVSLLKKAIKRSFNPNANAIDFAVEGGVDLNDSLINGHIGRNGNFPMAFQENNYKSRVAYFTEDELKGEREEVIAELKNFIRFLKKSNIRPILFSTPTFSDYNKHLNKFTLEKNEKDLKEICSEFDIPYWAYADDGHFLFEHYFDQDHLNKKGASKFSSILNERLLNYTEEQAN